MHIGCWKRTKPRAKSFAQYHNYRVKYVIYEKQNDNTSSINSHAFARIVPARIELCVVRVKTKSLPPKIIAES